MTAVAAEEEHIGGMVEVERGRKATMATCGEQEEEDESDGEF